ncbi:hypothetical protein CesoFtcFv8_001977 [Champsocephalus esox]|uniref:Uncharacterized protein n=1 Tax=Champsocephalus esox TaxID=159716 RepID=A0AAN8HE82_9TELE|nr:hypothetical protein CesoFtcFv8_001977 [Champsocephalus esox]
MFWRDINRAPSSLRSENLNDRCVRRTLTHTLLLKSSAMERYSHVQSHCRAAISKHSADLCTHSAGEKPLAQWAR